MPKHGFKKIPAGLMLTGITQISPIQTIFNSLIIILYNYLTHWIPTILIYPGNSQFHPRFI